MTDRRTLVFATNNPHKLDELRMIIGREINVVSLADIGCRDEIPETHDTLEGNALEKARWIYDRYGYDCFADDTGLEVDALGGAPGVRSARYAGDGHDGQANMQKLLRNMASVDLRTARFRTVIALVEGGNPTFFEGSVEGNILRKPRGQGGFGYDPVFLPDGATLTFAEMSPEEKNSLSHRAKAVARLIDYLENKR